MENEKQTKGQEKKTEESSVQAEAPKEQISANEKQPAKQTVKPKQKMDEAVVQKRDMAMSIKHAIAICRFIKNKSIEQAVSNLESVVSRKKAVPMHGEIPHRKGMMSGRYPVKASLQFIKLLKNLAANASVNGMDISIVKIVIAKADTASTTRYHRRNWKFKRAHVTLIAKETIKKQKEEEKKK